MPNSPTTAALPLPPPGTPVTVIVGVSSNTKYVPPPYPPIFTALPLEGTFKWSLSWEGHPSGSFEFRTRAFLKETVIQSLREGTEFNAWGVGFRVGNLSIVEIPATLQPMRMISVSVSLGGKHENYVDRVVALRSGSTNTSNTNTIDPDCFGQMTPTQQVQAQNPTETSVAALATKAGDVFSGPSMPVPIPRDTLPSVGTTFLSKAQEQLRQNGCFLRFSDPDAVKAITLQSVSTWTFQESDIRSPINASPSGKKVQPFVGGAFHPLPLGSILPAIPIPAPALPVPVAENQSVYPFIHTYEPRHKIEGTFSLSGQLQEPEPTQGSSDITTVPTWTMREPVIQTIPDGDVINPNLPPANTGSLKDLSNVFSQSGVTKTYKLATTEDGLPVSDYLEKWGFIFYLKDMYQDNVLLGAVNVWGLIEQKYTTYLYDPIHGYALGSDTIGWELVRHEEETEQGNNTIDLATGDPALELITYFANPYRRQERNYLKPLRSQYKDVELPPLLTYKICLPSGASELAYMPDPTWTEPYFVAQNTVHENSFKVMADPNDPTKLKTTGKEAFHRKFITVLPSKNTTVNVSPALGQLDSEELEQDAYNEYTSVFSSQDAGYANSLDTTDFVRNSDRPPLATKKPSLLERVPPPGGEPSTPAIPTGYNYYAYTNLDPFYSASTSKLQGGSLSYPTAKTLEQAKMAAKTEITISNIRDCLQESFTIPFSPHIKDGDRLTYTCNGTVRQRRVLSISHEVQIKALVENTMIVTSSGSVVSCGLERVTPVQFTQEQEPSNSQNQPTSNVSDLFIANNQPLGEILDPGLQTRRNFL